jgi:hypothetical protein
MERPHDYRPIYATARCLDLLRPRNLSREFGFHHRCLDINSGLHPTFSRCAALLHSTSLFQVRIAPTGTATIYPFPPWHRSPYYNADSPRPGNCSRFYHNIFYSQNLPLGLVRPAMRRLPASAPGSTEGHTGRPIDSHPFDFARSADGVHSDKRC